MKLFPSHCQILPCLQTNDSRKWSILLYPRYTPNTYHVSGGTESRYVHFQNGSWKVSNRFEKTSRLLFIIAISTGWFLESRATLHRGLSFHFSTVVGVCCIRTRRRGWSHGSIYPGGLYVVIPSVFPFYPYFISNIATYTHRDSRNLFNNVAITWTVEQEYVGVPFGCRSSN